MSVVEVSPVRGDTELQAFIRFPWEVYRGDPYWVPPLLSERGEFHDKDENPFFKHADIEYFLARRGDKIVGTVAAFTNHAHNTYQEENAAFFGCFEVLDDDAAAAALLQAVETWAREAGRDKVIGPAQFSTNDEVGLLVDGFDDAPRVLMTYNPKRYVHYLERAGFQTAMDLFAYAARIEDFFENIPPKLERVVGKVTKRRNLKIRNINMRDFDQEVERFKRVYNKSWERNWGFVPMNDEEINHLAKNLRQIIDPDLVFMVEHEGEVIGVSLTLPDLNAPLRLAYPQPGVPEIWTMLKMLWHWKIRPKMDWIRVFALGVLPEYRGMGVDAMMYLETARAAKPKGVHWAEMSWILADNEMMNRSIRMLGGEVYKTHRMYEKHI